MAALFFMPLRLIRARVNGGAEDASASRGTNAAPVIAQPAAQAKSPKSGGKGPTYTQDETYITSTETSSEQTFITVPVDSLLHGLTVASVSDAGVDYCAVAVRFFSDDVPENSDGPVINEVYLPQPGGTVAIPLYDVFAPAGAELQVIHRAFGVSSPTTYCRTEVSLFLQEAKP